MVFAKAVEQVIGKGQGLNYERFLLFALALYHLDTEGGKRVVDLQKIITTQVYFDILDGEKKGYLDREAIDKFTKDVAQKASTKERVISYPTITQLVFDSLQPTDSKKYNHNT